MISLLPSYRETLVLSNSREQVHMKILGSTSQEPGGSSRESQLLFSGSVHADGFGIFLRSRRPGHFLPFLSGRIEPTRTGCILFLRYTLFPITRVLILLWSFLIFAGTLIAGFITGLYPTFLFGTLLLIVIHMITWSNFYLHLKPIREAIRRVVG